MENFQEYAKGRVKSTSVAKYSNQDQKVSSTRIRSVLGAGDVEYAAELLGRPYHVKGFVIHGDKEAARSDFRPRISALKTHTSSRRQVCTPLKPKSAALSTTASAMSDTSRRFTKNGRVSLQSKSTYSILTVTYTAPKSRLNGISG